MAGLETNLLEHRTILLVEPEALVALDTEEILRRHGARVLTARTGDEAIEAATSEDPRHGCDLILMDIELRNGVDGTEAARRILAEKNLPIVFYSSLDDPATIRGIDDIPRFGYVRKDAGEVILIESISMALRLFETIRTLDENRLAYIRAYEEAEQSRQRIEHLNRVLLSIRNANQLMTQERDPVRLLDGICDLLIETHGYSLASIVLFDRRGFPEQPFFHAGFGKRFAPMVSYLDSGAIPRCAREAIDQGRLVVTDTPFTQCRDCPFSTIYERNAAFTVPVGFRGHLGGYLVVSVPREFSADPEEQAMVREIADDIGFSLSTMRIEEERRRFEAAYRNIWNLADQLICTADITDGTFRMVNPSFSTVLGYPHDDLIGRPLYSLVHPDDLNRTTETMARLTAGEEVLQFTNRFKKSDGSYVILEWNAHPVLEDGTMYAIAHDVTEKEMLLREVHHRIKNNMSLITSLLHLQAEEISDDEGSAALLDAEHRVQAMEVLYRKLYTGRDFRSVPAEEYLEPLAAEILSGFPDGGFVRLDVRIDHILLDAAVLLPLGIILNELITNTMKYAFVDFTDARVTIELSREETGELRFLVADNGVGMPASVDFSNSTGFGMRLVDTLSSQLRGTTRIGRDGGTAVEIRIPLRF